MGVRFSTWDGLNDSVPQNLAQLRSVIYDNRKFSSVDKLEYGDYGLESAFNLIVSAIKSNRRIALYADYDVDGTMSAVSWHWFLEAIGYRNVLHYIPCRFREGYGVNLQAIKTLIHERGAELIITMDTGITANEEAAYCRSQGVDFICTDHHKIQIDKMPDCVVLNPKLHPDPDYQELCGCGVTFVLLRKLAQVFPISPDVWQDLLAIAGIATICDVVPLNGVNHKLAQLGVRSLLRSRREVLVKLRQATAMLEGGDEKDIGFRIGPRINAVGRLEHADAVVEAFLGKSPDMLIRYMGDCNEKRKLIQQQILREAEAQAALCGDAPILFLGGDWHPGVVGIAASKIAEKFWRPTWLFQRNEEQLCKGSARSILGFDVTEAMASCGKLFAKFGGHRAAGGYSFDIDDEADIRSALISYADGLKHVSPELWRSRQMFDCELPLDLLDLELLDLMDEMKPFGNGFEEPKFVVRANVASQKYYNDKETGAPKHSVVLLTRAGGVAAQKLMFFNEVLPKIPKGQDVSFLVTVARNKYMGKVNVDLFGLDWNI